MLAHARPLSAFFRRFDLPEERVTQVRLEPTSTSVSLSFTTEEDAAVFGKRLGDDVKASRVRGVSVSYYLAEVSFRKRIYNLYLYFDVSSASSTLAQTRVN